MEPARVSDTQELADLNKALATPLGLSRPPLSPIGSRRSRSHGPLRRTCCRQPSPLSRHLAAPCACEVSGDLPPLHDMA